MWRSARAKVLAALGRHVEAERFVREAPKLAVETDDLNMHPDTLMDLMDLAESFDSRAGTRRLAQRPKRRSSSTGRRGT